MNKIWFKKNIKIILIMLLILAFSSLLMLYVNLSGWHTVNIYNHEYSEGIIYLDLDNDKSEDKIDLKSTGRLIAINDKDYTVNEYYDEKNNHTTYFGDTYRCYYDNSYNILDLNNDGYLEIIHATSNHDCASPSSVEYTLFNYKDDSLYKIGNISIIGSIPETSYVKGNTLKFKYIPSESNMIETETVTLDLD